MFLQYLWPTANLDNNITWMPSLATVYILATTAIFFYTVHDHLSHSDTYFKAVMTYLADQKCVFILYNMILSLAILSYRVLTAVFFVNTMQGEVIKISDKLKSKIVDLIILAYIIDLKFNFQMYLLVVLVTYTFILHNHLIFRSEYLVHVHTTSAALSLHYRAVALYLLLFFVDYQILKYIFGSMLSVSESTEALFVYYMITNAFSLLEPFMQFAIDFYQKYTFTHIKNSDQLIASASIFITIPRLIIELLLCLWLSVQFKQIFFTIIRGFQIISNIKKTYESYTRIKKLSETMTHLKKIKGQELEQFHDLTCTVCYEDMKQSVVLPCKHIFHEECIRQWIIKNLNHFCPKCKHQLNFDNVEALYEEKKKETTLDKMRELIRQREEEEKLDSPARERRQEEAAYEREIKQYKYNRENQRQQYPSSRHQYQKRSRQNQRQVQHQRLQRQVHHQRLQREQPLSNSRQFYKNYRQKERQYQQPRNRARQRVQVIDPSGEPLPLRQYIINRPDLSQLPLQVYESQRKKIVPIGSLPFSLPTLAVPHRTARHMSKRGQYVREMQIITRLMEMNRNEQLLLL